MRRLAFSALLAALAACHGTRAADPARAVAPRVVRHQDATAPKAPRYFPRSSAALTFVDHTDDGTAAMHGGMRLLLRGEGSLPESAATSIAAGPSAGEGGAPTATTAGRVIVVPPRLGGGYVFVVGRELWHAPAWLAPPTRLFELTGAPQVYLGLDALVAHEPGRAPFAFRIDGAQVPLTHFPHAPNVAELATRDARHAAVVADLRGLSITEDGGTTWRAIESARTPLGVKVAPGGYVVRGRNGSDEREVSWRIDVHGEVRGDVSPAAPVEPKVERMLAATTAWERTIEHGYEDPARDRWVVLDHGVLERHARSDGALLGRVVVGSTEDSCRPIHWPSAEPGADPGFACIGPTGTSLWRVGATDATRVLQLPGRRRVWSSEVGSLAVEGPCERAPVRSDVSTLCVWGRGPKPVTVRLQGAVAGDWTIPLRDGTLAVLRPPTGPLPQRRAAEMFVDPAAASADAAGSVRGIPLRLAGVAKPEIATHLAEGHWLGDPYALERGGFGGWVEHEGRLLGFAVSREGTLEVGPRSTVASVHRVAGARSLSWSAGGAAFESVDGGLHYAQIGLPALDAAPGDVRPGKPVEPAAASARAVGCTAVGCMLPGLLRVGWGAEIGRSNQPERPRATAPLSLPGSRIALDCTLVARSADAPAKGRPPVRSGAVFAHMPLGLRGYGSSATGALGPFHGTSPPAVRPDQVLQGMESVDLADRRSTSFFGRIFLWGTNALGADPGAGWQWRWFDVRTHTTHVSAIATPPDELSLHRQMQSMPMSRGVWSVVVGDDPRHALGLHGDGTRTRVFGLVEGEAPDPVELADGTELGAVDSALVAPGNRAIFAAAVGDPAGTAVYLARGTKAERIARIPRLGSQGKPSPALVALHADGIRVAIAVEDHDVPSRSDAAFYLREAFPADGPIRRFAVAATTPGATRTLRVCQDDAAGFDGWARLDLPGGVTLAGRGRTFPLGAPVQAKLRFRDDGGLCVLELAARIDGEGELALASAKVGTAAAGSHAVALEQNGRHFALACSAGERGSAH